MDKIFIRDMKFYGYHGVLAEEKRIGQCFIVDVIIETDLKKAGETDSIKETINYAEVYALCKDIVEGERNNLIEAVAEKVATAILNQFSQAKNVVVKVIKPNPPINGHLHSVAVEVKRGRRS